MNDILVYIINKVLQSATDKQKQDALLDKIEEWIEETDTQLDDEYLLPMLRAYRTAANVPDND